MSVASSVLALVVAVLSIGCLAFLGLESLVKGKSVFSLKNFLGGFLAGLGILAITPLLWVLWIVLVFLPLVALGNFIAGPVGAFVGFVVCTIIGRLVYRKMDDLATFLDKKDA